MEFDTNYGDEGAIMMGTTHRNGAAMLATSDAVTLQIGPVMCDDSTSSPFPESIPRTNEDEARAMRRHKRIPWHVRRAVALRDEGTCQYCGLPGKTSWSGAWVWIEHEFDHVFPVSRGGLSVVENVVIACRSCNRSKGAKVLGRVH